MSEVPSGQRVDPLRAEEVLDEVLLAPADTRDATLERLCAGDVALRTEVKSLLRHLPDPENPDQPSPPSGEIELEGRLIGGCRIERLLGRGGTGRVFRAIQEWPPRPVAVKVLRPELLGEGARRRFRREARALARLDHPGIARILSAGLHREGQIELPFVVMEVVDDAQTLTAWWRGTDRTLADRLELFATVCEAVHHGHVRGLVHRDLKPSNVLVGGDGRARVIDFSVASMTAEDGGMMTLTRAIAGTPGYMAPEQFEGGDAVDLRTDVHALGLLLFECLAGRPAYARDGLSIASAARLITAETAPSLASIERSLAGNLDTIVSHAIAKAPADRYQSAAELAGDIRRHLSGHPILAKPATPLMRARLFARRNPVAATAISAA
ncbi:MAG: serine/threonine-protein kinase, partial [Planctomycetota bacterium]